MISTEIPSRGTWKQDLAPYLQVDELRSLGQIASVVIPYLAVWVVAALIEPTTPVAIALGLVATVFLTRMYSLFHDLTHNSMFESREANSRWGHLLGYLLFTPYRWWQRQHRIHHAHTGDLDHRGVGEINTMTLAEYESASRLRRLGYRLYRNPLLMLLAGPQPGVPLRAPLPAARHDASDPGERRRDEPGARRLGAGLVDDRRLGDLLAHPGNHPDRRRCPGGLDALHPAPVRGHLLPGAGQVAVRARRAAGESRTGSLPRPLAWVVGNANFHHVHHLSAKIPNYNLRAAHEGHPMFERTPVVTIRSSFRTFRLKLWDIETESLVRFPKVLAQSGEARRA